MSPWGTLRALRERALICATESDEPISGADAVDELAAIREQLDAALAKEPNARVVFDELHAAIEASAEASWSYAEAESGTDESREAGELALCAIERRTRAENAARAVAGVPRLRRAKR